uniref:BTB domain-containing protein n=1 Tax=Lactuca sativa TaxID=4236 RepID=A0A9R1VRF8_LACSA|nr:hypothetical protein LSAT_V11C400170230 [Lactuca sativa]
MIRTAVMESSYSSEVGRSDGDFGFAFNDSNFSDRLLCIEIVSEPLGFRPDGEGCMNLAACFRNPKRRREDIIRENALDIASGYSDEQVQNQPDHILDDGMDNEIQDEEQETMIEEPHTPLVARVKTIHISSPILAAKSPFFYKVKPQCSQASIFSTLLLNHAYSCSSHYIFMKLFSNGMKDSEQRKLHVNLRINDSEEAPFMELLNFIYSNTLTSTSAPALLDVLMAADKFKVVSCMRHCSNLLRNLPMTPESALLYLDLPSTVSMAEAVQPLTNTAKEFLTLRYKDITKLQDEILNLSLAGVEAVLSSDDLQKAIRKIMTCNEFDPKFALESLFSKAESQSLRKNPNPPRVYKYRPVKVVGFELPRQQCIVYMDLKREECVGGKAVGYRNLFGIPLGSFIEEGIVKAIQTLMGIILQAKMKITTLSYSVSFTMHCPLSHGLCNSLCLGLVLLNPIIILPVF